MQDPDFAAELLHVKLALDKANGVEPGRASGLAGRDGVEPHRSFMWSRRMTNNAMRLVDQKRLKGVDLPLRHRVDILNTRPPGGKGATYHQDSSEHGSDRVGELQFWLACDFCHVSPTLVHVSQVHVSQLRASLPAPEYG